MKDSYVVGVDIGGSHITAALIDMHTKKIVEGSYIRQLINAGEDVTAIITGWSSVIRRSMNAHVPVAKIGIAMPGPFDYENGICLIRGQDKYELLYNLNVKKLLAKELDIDGNNIHLMNDAGCFLQGEVFGGAGQGTNSAIGVTLGTGLGSARYENNKATDADLWCMPFKDSIAEDYLSTRWFIKRYYELSGQQVANVKELVNLTTNEKCRQLIFDEFGANLASFFMRFIDAWKKPEIIIIGGNIALTEYLFMPELKKNLLSFGLDISIEIAKLGEAAPIFGAAGYWFSAPMVWQI
ncbi:MAG: ROK family protein [Bacteroidota bacterium]